MMRLRHEEDAQGMAEFILVLPLLALLTFGTIEVAIYLQQQSTLNAAAFMAARAASVLGNEKGPTQASANSFADASGAPWLQQAVSGMKADHSAQRSRFVLEAKTDRLSGLIDGLTNGQATGFDTLAAGATMPLEYNAKQFGQRNITGVQVSHYLISYDSQPVKMYPDAVNNGAKNLKLAVAPVQKLLEAAQKFKLTIKPTPAPAAPPPKSQPGKPTPRPTTRPSTAPTLEIRMPELPGVRTIVSLAGRVGPEPFRKDGAVVPNPKHGNNSGDGKEATSSQYLEPLYEKKAAAGVVDVEKRRIQNILEELKNYDDAVTSGKLDVLLAGQGLGSLNGNALPGELGKAIPPAHPSYAAVLAAWKTFYNAAVLPAQKNGGLYGKNMQQDAKKAYEKREPEERKLFK
jgi:hypothetical protein